MAVRSYKALFVCSVALLAVLPAAPAFAQSREERDAPGPRAAAISSGAQELEPVAVPEPSELALRFYRSSNWLWLLNVSLGLIIPGVLAFSGFSARLRNLARRLGRVWFCTIGLYLVMYLAIVFVIELPLAYYTGYVRLHEYGLSNQTHGKWFHDSIIALGISMVVGVAVVWVPYLLMAHSPKRWWLYATLLSVPFLFAGTLVLPIWVAPLFNRFGPMKTRLSSKRSWRWPGRPASRGAGFSRWRRASIPRRSTLT